MAAHHAQSMRRPVWFSRLLHFQIARASIETVDVGRVIVGVVVNGAAGIPQLTPVLQPFVGTVSLARGVGARSRQRCYGENDSGEA